MVRKKAAKKGSRKGPKKRILKKTKKRYAKKPARKHKIALPRHPEKIPAKKIRSGMRILIGYSIILCFIYIFYFLIGIYKPELLFLGGEFMSYAALLIDIVLVAALIYLIYGLVKRKIWAWWFCILWYAVSIINSVWSVYMMRFNVYNILHELLILSSLFIVLINALIIWYIHSKRTYFTAPHKEERFEKKDKIFVYSLAGFWILLILISLSVGYDFYKDTTSMADAIIEELKDTTPLHAIEICETKKGKEKDICFVVFVTVFERYDLAPVCSRIESDLYRFSCMQAKG